MFHFIKYFISYVSTLFVAHKYFMEKLVQKYLELSTNTRYTWSLFTSLADYDNHVKSFSKNPNQLTT